MSENDRYYDSDESPRWLQLAEAFLLKNFPDAEPPTEVRNTILNTFMWMDNLGGIADKTTANSFSLREITFLCLVRIDLPLAEALGWFFGDQAVKGANTVASVLEVSKKLPKRLFGSPENQLLLFLAQLESGQRSIDPQTITLLNTVSNRMYLSGLQRPNWAEVKGILMSEYTTVEGYDYKQDIDDPLFNVQLHEVMSLLSTVLDAFAMPENRDRFMIFSFRFLADFKKMSRFAALSMHTVNLPGSPNYVAELIKVATDLDVSPETRQELISKLQWLIDKPLQPDSTDDEHLVYKEKWGQALMMLLDYKLWYISPTQAPIEYVIQNSFDYDYDFSRPAARYVYHYLSHNAMAVIREISTEQDFEVIEFQMNTIATRVRFDEFGFLDYFSLLVRGIEWYAKHRKMTGDQVLLSFHKPSKDQLTFIENLIQRTRDIHPANFAHEVTDKTFRQCLR